MPNRNRNRTTENHGHPSEELILRLTDQLLKIKAYKDKEAIGDPKDVSRLLENVEYRRHFLLEAMESDDPKLRQLGMDAFMLDGDIRHAGAQKTARTEEPVVDEPSVSVLSARKVPEVIFARHEEKDVKVEPTTKTHARPDAPRRKTKREKPILNEVIEPQAVDEEDSRLSGSSDNGRSIDAETESYETESYETDKMIATYEHSTRGADLHDRHSDGDFAEDELDEEDLDEEDLDEDHGEEGSDDGGHKQPLGTYGVIAALVLLLILAIAGTEEEEGGEEPAQHGQPEMQAPPSMPEAPPMTPPAPAMTAPEPAPSTVQPWTPPPSPAYNNKQSQSNLPPLLPSSALDPQARGILRVHGSNTVDAELMPMIMMNFLASKGATDVKFIGISPFDRVIQAKLPDRKVPVTIEISGHDSGTAFTDLDENKASIGVASRPITGPEISKLVGRYGNLHSPAGEHVIGLDGLAIVVNHKNPVRSLTMEQVAGVFSGKIADWSQVGGQPGRIHVYARDERFGTWDTFKYLVLDRHNQGLATTHRRFESDVRLSDSVAADPSGVGFVALPHIRNSKALAIADSASTMPIMPSRFNVETEEYALSRRFYMYTSPRQHQKLIDDLTFYISSPEGQANVQNAGFIPQTIYKVKPLPPQHATPAYLAMTKDAERLSLNFHFLSGRIELDIKGIHDISRVVNYIEANPAKKILLLGFTDSKGKKVWNEMLSVKRAELVAQRLREYGIVASTIKGFGESMPIANNDIEFGRNRNRRVEVWVK